MADAPQLDGDDVTRAQSAVSSRLRGLWLLGAICLALALQSHQAGSHGHGEQFADWFMSLTRPGGGSCCSLSDGRTTEVRIVRGGAGNAPDHYEALIDERFTGGAGVGWVEIKQEAVLSRVDNPTGEPVVFWTPYQGVLCFVRATES